MKQHSFLIFFSALFFVSSAQAQHTNLSLDAKISVLTFGPGAALNDAFGHNGFRITDPKKGIDWVYGYGDYDFDTPNFYLKFAQGKLNYLISRSKFSDVFSYYSFYNRTISEQVLNLSASEKQKLFQSLETNYKPENRTYLYDFFYDNCATRIRDVTEIANVSKIKFISPKGFQPKTFRTLIHDHVGLNTWGSFGIDLALGSVIDKPATAYEHMFLPKYIHHFFGAAKKNASENLVESQSVLFQKKDSDTASHLWWSPLVIFSVIALLILYLTFLDHKKNTRSRWLDFSLFLITGILGVIMLLLWFATDHTATAQNYNVLWAFPLNLLIGVQLLKPKVKNWVKSYIKFLIIMLCLLTLHWCVGVQVFAIGLIPFLIALLIRYIFLVRYFNPQ